MLDNLKSFRNWSNNHAKKKKNPQEDFKMMQTQRTH